MKFHYHHGSIHSLSRWRRCLTLNARTGNMEEPTKVTAKKVTRRVAVAKIKARKDTATTHPAMIIEY